MHLSVEPLTSQNLRDVLHLWPDRAIFSDDEFAVATAASERLLAEELSQGAVIRCDGRPLSFGMTVFVSDAFVTGLMRAPRPHIGKRLLTSADHPSSPILTAAQIARGNAGHGLHMAVVVTHIDPDVANRAPILGTLIQAFVDTHAGFRIQTIINEVFGTANVTDIKTANAFTTLGLWDPATSDVPMPALLAMLSAEEAIARRSVFLPMFVYQPPQIGFSRAECAVLRAALDGVTDEELSAHLGVSLPAIKARWRRMLERAAELPTLFPVPPHEPDVQPSRAAGSGRGKQVRHRLLRFVRANPSELRPYPSMRRGRTATTARIQAVADYAEAVARRSTESSSGF